MKGKGIVIMRAMIADQMSTAGPVLNCPAMMAAMKTPWMDH